MKSNVQMSETTKFIKEFFVGFGVGLLIAVCPPLWIILLLLNADQRPRKPQITQVTFIDQRTLILNLELHSNMKSGSPYLASPQKGRLSREFA